MLKFDQKVSQFFEDAYQGSDITRRRRASFDTVDPKPGETVLDLGCGPGMLTLELARAVGSAGRIFGVDPSAPMRAAASERCKGRDTIQLLDGAAAAAGLDDASVDKAVSVQVFEYLDDIPGALDELHRVLRPAGRLVISDIHWNSLIWHTNQPDRMARMIAAWDGHLADPGMPQKLPGLLSAARFSLDHIRPISFCDTDLRPDGLSQMIMNLMASYARDNDLLPATEIDNWQAEQRELADAGQFFFSITQFVCTATRG